MLRRILYAPAATAEPGSSTEDDAGLMGWAKSMTTSKIGPDDPPVDKKEDKHDGTKTTADAPPADKPNPLADSTVPPAKPAEPKPDTDEEHAPKNAADWAKYKEKRSKRETELSTQIAEKDKALNEMSAKLKEFESKPAAGEPDERFKSILAEKDKLIEELSQTIVKVDIREEPRFKKYYGDKVESIKGLIKEALGEKSTAFFEINDMPAGDYKKSRMDEFYAELSPQEQSELGAARLQMRQTLAERDAEIAKAEDHKKTTTAEAKAKQEADAKTWEAAFNNTKKALQDPKTGDPMYRYQTNEDGTPNTAWNAQVDARIASALARMTGKGMTREAIVKTAMDAEALPVVKQFARAEIEKLNKEIAALQEQIKGLTASNPTLKRGEGKTIPNGAKDDINMKSEDPQGPMRDFVKGLIRST